MRIIVFFDLPTITAQNKRDYRRFRKFLVESGFLMMQESVYCKLVQNSTAADSVVEKVRKQKPPQGLVQALRITERQFTKIEFITGTMHSDVIDTDDRLVIL